MKINKTLLILDTETGGVDPENSSLMEIGCIVLKDFKIVHSYASYVKSKDGKYFCNDFARKLHGISDEILEKEGKFPKEIMLDLKNIRDTYFNGEPMTIVAHNTQFDISFVKKMFKDGGEILSSEILESELDFNKIFSRNSIDTATLALVLRLQNKLPFDRCSLDNILTHYEIETKTTKRHSALFDAKQTAKAFVLMFNELSGEKQKTTKKSKSFDTDFDDSKKLNN